MSEKKGLPGVSLELPIWFKDLAIILLGGVSLQVLMRLQWLMSQGEVGPAAILATIPALPGLAFATLPVAASVAAAIAYLATKSPM
jgi:hypothetical protein